MDPKKAAAILAGLSIVESYRPVPRVTRSTKRTRYVPNKPHQGAKEKARRKRQLSAGIIQP